MRNTRRQPGENELRAMDREQLAKHARREAKFLEDQKQTAVPRLLRELASRL